MQEGNEELKRALTYMLKCMEDGDIKEVTLKILGREGKNLITEAHVKGPKDFSMEEQLQGSGIILAGSIRHPSDPVEFFRTYGHKDM